jgi:hypothetical protein
VLRVISWNIGHRAEAWKALSTSNADVALLQEASRPPAECAAFCENDVDPWMTEGAGIGRPWRTCVVPLAGNLEFRRHVVRSICDAGVGEVAASRVGTLSAADVRDPQSGEMFTLISMYAAWERPQTSTGSDWIYADASVHRLISDLSIFIGRERGHRVVAAGDLNILYGHGERGNKYWAARYQTIFDRLAAIGLSFVGPQSPNGRQADPWPAELPPTSRNVPTYHTNRQSPASATRQLDFVFASHDIADRLAVRALNDPQDWGPSDHCRIRIEIA